MSKILIASSGPDDWQQFLADPQKQWKRCYSAMAAALSWEAAQGLPPEAATMLGRDAKLLFAIPEHKVALPGGRRESQCDLFALARTEDETIAVAVEAKVNEPFGPTVGEWMVGASAGKTERITLIRDLVGLVLTPASWFLHRDMLCSHRSWRPEDVRSLFPSLSIFSGTCSWCAGFGCSP